MYLINFEPNPFQTFGTEGLDHALSKREDFDIAEAATSFVASKLGIDSEALKFETSAVTDASKHAFLKQQAVSNCSCVQNKNRMRH